MRLVLVCKFCVAVAIFLFSGGLEPCVAEDLPREIRVLSYNIHHGRGLDDKVDLERIAEVILSVKPDLVAVQEVDQKARRTEGVDQPAELARLTKMEVVFGKNIDFEGGGY